MTREEFWEGIRKSAALLDGFPAWAKAGINLCPTNFESVGVTTEQCASFGCRACKAAKGNSPDCGGHIVTTEVSRIPDDIVAIHETGQLMGIEFERARIVEVINEHIRFLECNYAGTEARFAKWRLQKLLREIET